MSEQNNQKDEQEQAGRSQDNTPQPSDEILERTAGVRQGDPNDARYYGSQGLPDSGFGTGQTDYGGSQHSVGSPVQNYQPGYGMVPGYGAMGTQGTQGVSNEQQPHVSRDEHIRRDVLQRLAASPELAGCTFEIEVVNSIVTVRGQVANSVLRHLAYDIIEAMREVRDVTNQLTVG